MDRKELKKKLGSVLSTPEGSEILRYLRDAYMLTSSKGETVEETYWNLSRKELVIELIRLVDNKKDVTVLN